MDSSERGMNPVAMAIINPWIEYWLSRGLNQRPPVLKSATLPTMRHGYKEWSVREIIPISQNKMFVQAKYLFLKKCTAF